jgi:hypothetical protein
LTYRRLQAQVQVQILTVPVRLGRHRIAGRDLPHRYIHVIELYFLHTSFDGIY